MIKGELRPRDTKLVKVTAKSVKEQRPELDLKPILIHHRPCTSRGYSDSLSSRSRRVLQKSVIILWKNYTAALEKVLVIRRHLLRPSVVQKTVKLKALLKMREEVKNCYSWTHIYLF